MDIQKITHDIYEASRHWHLPLLASLICSIKIIQKDIGQEEISDLGEVTGDNILPKEILISLSSHRSL